MIDQGYAKWQTAGADIGGAYRLTREKVQGPFNLGTGTLPTIAIRHSCARFLIA